MRPWRALACTATTAVASSLLWLVLSLPLAPLVLAVALLHDRWDDTNMVVAAVLGLVGVGLFAILGPRLALVVAAVERWRLRLGDVAPAPARRRGGLYTDPATWRAVAYVLLLGLVAPLWLGVLALAGLLVVSTPVAVYHRIAGTDSIGNVAGRARSRAGADPGAAFAGLGVRMPGSRAVARMLLCAEPDPAAAELVEVTRSRARMADAFDAERRADRARPARRRSATAGQPHHATRPRQARPAGRLARRRGRGLGARAGQDADGRSCATSSAGSARRRCASWGCGPRWRNSPPAAHPRYPSTSARAGTRRRVETVAYFAAVSEALANTAKHAAAGQAAGHRPAVRRSADRRGARRRARRCRPVARVGPHGSRRPGGGGRGPVAHVQPGRRADDPAGGVAVRVVIAEDSVLLREGLAGLLARFGFEVVAAVGDAAALLRRGARRPRPTWSSPTCACRRASPTRGCGPRWRCAPADPGLAVVVLSQYVQHSYAGELLGSGDGPGHRLSAQGPGGRRRGVRRRAAPGRRRRHGRRPRGGAAADAAPPRPARPPVAARSARCWRWSPRATRTRRSPASSR